MRVFSMEMPPPGGWTQGGGGRTASVDQNRGMMEEATASTGTRNRHSHGDENSDESKDTVSSTSTQI